MGEEEFPPPPLPASATAFHKNGLSSSLRFLGVLEQTDSGENPNQNPFELDESDVVWSASAAAEFSSVDADGPDSPAFHNSAVSSDDSASSFSPSSTGWIPHRRDRGPQHRRAFAPANFGLSAALLEDPLPLVRHPAVDPSISAAWAVVVPVKKPEEPVKKPYRQTAPVNVPVWPRKVGKKKDLDRVEEWGEVWREEDAEEDDGEMLPPHLIVARSHVMTFSVFEGVGRTLKGRDLRRVRNAVWQKTGFLD